MDIFVKFWIAVLLGVLFLVFIFAMIEVKDKNTQAGKSTSTDRITVTTSKYSSAGLIVMDTLEHDGHKWVAATRRGVGGVSILHHPDCICFSPAKPSGK